MKITLTVKEIKEMNFIENTFSRMVKKNFKVDILTTSVLFKKVEEAQERMGKNTTAMSLSIDRKAETVTLDIDENLVIDLISTFGDLVKAIVALVSSYESNFNTILSKYSTKKFIEEKEKNEREAEIRTLKARLTELGV